ncbi:hypothetical protein [Ruegeria sp.]|uniref:hypothetical protein n=1 Tax=Ruegeria sp. TaxID=1879320 RepID=UPI003C79EFF2
MKSAADVALRWLQKTAQATLVFAMVASCAENELGDDPFAPGVDPDGEAVDEITVGNRLMVAGEYELAMDSFTRAALTGKPSMKSRWAIAS